MAQSEQDSPAPKGRAIVQRTSDREMQVTRTIDGPARIVFEAWSQPELFKQWWVPKSVGVKMLSCEMDVRTGGTYKLVFEFGEQQMAFFGKYLEVTPHARIVWTNEEEEGGPVTTVTFEEKDEQTFLTVHELYPSKEALDAALESGSSGIDAMPETLEQLNALLVTLRERA